MVVMYMRISSHAQRFGRQEFILDKLGVKFDKYYVDKVSGKTKDRPGLNKMLQEIEPGSTVYCESLSRLGRNLKDILEIIDDLVSRKVRVVIVKEGIDTSNNTYKLLLGIFGAVSELEAEQTRERVLEGIQRCKDTGTTKTGRWFGREEITKDKLPNNFTKYYLKMKQNEITKVEMSKLLDVSRATLYRWIKIYESGL